MNSCLLEKDTLNLFMDAAAWWRLARGEHALMVVVAIVVGALFTMPEAPLLHLLLAAIGPALITSASFIFNDYMDYASDVALRRLDRPLVARRITRSAALTASQALFPIGVAASLLGGVLALMIAAAYAALGAAYSLWLKRLPLVGNAAVASTYAIPFLYGAILTSGVGEGVALIAAIAFCAGLSRELFITLRDVEGDRRIGATTLPMLLGSRATAYISAMLLIASIALTYPFLPKLRPASGTLLFICVALLAWTALSVATSQRREVLQRCRNYTLLAFATATLAFLALALGH